MILWRQPLVMGGILIAFVLAWASPFSFARAETPFDPSVRPNFSEPVVLASKDGRRAWVTDVSSNQCNIRGRCEWIFFCDFSRVCDHVVSSFEERFNESRSDPSRGTSNNCCFRRICHL